MPTTRKKIIKTVYKDDESEGETGDFSDSGSEAKISDAPSSDDEIPEEDVVSSEDDVCNKKNKVQIADKPPIRRRKPKFAKAFVNKINSHTAPQIFEYPHIDDENEMPSSQFSVKDLTDADKQLPSFLNLSESDSSDDESQPISNKKVISTFTQGDNINKEEEDIEYKDVWSNNIQDNSADIAKKTFLELEKHKTEIEHTKASVENYISKNKANQSDVSKNSASEFNVSDLLAQGEEVIDISPKKEVKIRRRKNDSDSEIEDWEEVNESKSIPQQGLQLFVEFPNAPKKSKKVDIEMMMKRKINRVKKEYQVYMHQVHVLCWIGHGNFVSHVLNDQEIMAAALAMVPKGCYPEERVTTKYVEQITSWFKDKLTLKQDKNEHKFKPKAPPLKNILLSQIKSRVTTAKKYNIFIFVAMLRALGLQCRVMFNFVTLPIRPPNSELCSLSMKKEDPNKSSEKVNESGEKSSAKAKKTNLKSTKCPKKFSQVDGIYDTSSDSESEFTNIAQLDGNDDKPVKSRNTRSARTKHVVAKTDEVNEDVAPPKRAKTDATVATDSRTKKSVDTNKLQPNPNDPPEKSKTAVSKKSARNTNHKTKIGKQETSLGNENTTKDVNDRAKTNTNEPKDLITRKSKRTTIKNDTEGNPKSVPATGIQKNVSKKDSNSNGTVKDPMSSNKQNSNDVNTNQKAFEAFSPRKTRSERLNSDKNKTTAKKIPAITVTDEKQEKVKSEFFSENNEPKKRMSLSRKRSHTNVVDSQKLGITKTKSRTKSAPGTSVEKSKYFENEDFAAKKSKPNCRPTKKEQLHEDKLRVSHKDLKEKVNPKNDVTGDLVNIIKNRIKVEKRESKIGIVKGKAVDSDEDSDFLPVEDITTQNDSDDDFKPTKISPKPKLTSKLVKKLDRRVLSSDDETVKQNKVNVWCEVFVEELEQWIAVDVIKGKVHCTNDLYSQTTHPVCYIVGWDNNNYLKDLTRRYVPHWNTVTRKQRAGPEWWRKAIQPWLGPKNARDKEEDEHLDRMQLEAPLPKSIAEYKNHPLYALRRHLLKFEAIYPPDATTLGFVRGEAVYSRDCVYICQSRDKWLKDAKVVRLGEQPYKIVKARPKWDKLSNKCITDKPLEVFGPWQVQDYEPPTAENGIVPRNPYGNVELFKPCMLPKKTVHIKLPGLNKVAKKLNIDCSPAITGFDFNGGFSHPVYEGFVVCEEFEEILTEAWLKDQEEQERKEIEKMETRVYGNWRRLIRGLMIRERLKLKYGFEEPTTSQEKPKKGPRLVVKKK